MNITLPNKKVRIYGGKAKIHWYQYVNLLVSVVHAINIGNHLVFLNYFSHGTSVTRAVTVTFRLKIIQHAM